MKYYKKKMINGEKIKFHRYMMEQYLGRKLNIFEAVHHIDGDIHNNNIENLELMSVEEHSSNHRNARKNKK